MRTAGSTTRSQRGTLVTFVVVLDLGSDILAVSFW